ncbi:uncharacterized protein BO97DRAFT_375373 [Aspergillus homomorphus CBS 101889]|uniref:Uncharacterized protein n=1 Tax=Aspergillus homomorphus (strain CBS 101889) TaxID=1450537 RepID=A0A395HM72_ASPHC|nr:hypothetical protein BO97DRAFT_375373 [Aspergillus homomorphus CBS 101889]RAL09042.1 hypothetical protein BO97DRAFT_375373 [Aspergillus homomorphus CBS 101889]
MMAYTPNPPSLLILFRELLNTIIYSAGDDPLLARAHQLFQKGPAQTNNGFLLAPISLGIVLTFLIRYIIGHVFMSILILETVEKQVNVSRVGDKKLAPSSRYLLQTSAVLYRRGGFSLLLSGIYSACTYWVMHTLVTNLSSILLPSPVAYIMASVLLAETRFFWTANTILQRDQLRFVSSPHDFRRWRALVLPTFIYSMAETIMMHLPALLNSRLAPASNEDVTIEGLSYIVRSDILISALMLFAQLFLLLPSYIVLILVQASLLPPTCETLIFRPSRQQQQGVRVGEIFSAVKQGPLQAWEAAQMIGIGRLLYCLEVYGKMCLCLLVIAAMVHLMVYSML